MISNKSDVYAYSSWYILFKTGILLTKIYLQFVSTIEVVLIVENNLNYCGPIDNSCHFCKSYYGMIVKEKILIFGFTNYINISLYEKYLDVLSDLIFVKKILTPFVDLVMSIIKLRLSSSGSFASHH